MMKWTRRGVGRKRSAFSIKEDIQVRWNLDIILEQDGRSKIWHHRTHNIVVNTGRQFMAEVITPATLGPSGSFTREQDNIIRYIGFGIGGTRQNNSDAAASPLSDAYPAGYGGTNLQTDIDPTVAVLERPVLVSSGPDLFMKEISTPGTLGAFNETTFIAVFTRTEINIGALTSVPISEIGLYLGSADPSIPNGAAGTYPGGTGHLAAYDTFDSISKTGSFQITVRWSWRFGV